MTYLLALCAAFCAATGAALQHREVAEVPSHQAGGLRLVLASLRRPGWLIGMGVLLAAPVFQFLALKVGDLTQVQPMLTTELLFLLAIIIVTHHQRPGRREWFGAAAIVIGLVGFLISANPHGGTKTLSTNWMVVLTVATALIVTVILVTTRFSRGWAKASLFGAAAASCFAYQASMTKVLAGTNASSLLTSPSLIGLAVGGGLGFYFFQHALRAGHVAASRASMVIVNPILSMVIGVLAFGEIISGGEGRIAVEVAGIAILLVGAYLLATSSMITEAESPGRIEVQATTP